MTPGRRKGTAGWVREEHRRAHNGRLNLHTEHNAPTCTFEPEKHLYTIGGIVVPSVSQVLTEERFIDFSDIPNGTLETARVRGSYVHEVLHYYLEGDFDLEDCVPVFRGYVDSALTYLAQTQKRPFFLIEGQPTVEYRFWHTRRMFAGTMDYLGWDGDDVLAIDDYKTGEPSDVAAPLQLAAYELGVRECLLPTLNPPYTGLIRRRALKLHKDGTPATPHLYQSPRDLLLFLSALACTQYRRNGMRHPE